MMRFEITSPAGTRFPSAAEGRADSAISPDGKYLVLLAGSGSKKPTLWVRSLDSLEATQLPGTEDAQYPFWSPTDAAVGFFIGDKLKRVPLNGGDPETLATIPGPMGGTWSTRGVILVGSRNGAIFKVADTGGTPQQLTVLDASKNQTAHRWPHFLPDNNHFVFECGVGGDSHVNHICGASLDDPTAKSLLDASSNADYASGYLFYYHEGALHAHPFDPNALSVTGPPMHAVERVAYDREIGRTPFSVSDNLLLYQPSRGSDTALSVVTEWKALMSKAKPDTH